MLDQGARSELADFLRLRRARLAPAAFGFPAGRTRRKPGLRREELAAAAGIGLTWYTALEQGKPIQVSAGFLDNLAGALQLSEAERTHLFALAQHRLPPLPTMPKPDEAAGRLQPVLQAIAAPAYLRNARFDVLGWNDANTAMFGNFAVFPPEERNLLRLIFTRDYHRRSMPDWEGDARALVARFRLNFGQAADAAIFQTLISDLNAVSADFRRLWAAHDVSDAGEGVTHLISPRHGERRFRHQVLLPEAMPDLRIIVFLPETA
ncbi:helix-turn-helix domain-containing protein [Acidisoma cellulosilytica]|uniref:Helix-turn-helix domain-containing protein n=1 Tax=Acidisoma cellulosilyticum TaxID=2802395 RepID=A0A964E2M5_9PROT|nr:helix-turn-helix transcriptional regulator [Acidisoma cellulosilyticum]MCB8879571.1 helix-turn-helix domain-containing protein [Acidisoma cellulosilyticum]